MASITINFILDSENDLDLLRWLESLPKRGRSRAVRDAIRWYLDRDSRVSLEDVYRAVVDLKRSGMVPVVNKMVDRDEPADIVRTLDGLGL
jgi:metal-responsive CopG/Arc/MetJ family transcriptional regulator